VQCAGRRRRLRLRLGTHRRRLPHRSAAVQPSSNPVGSTSPGRDAARSSTVRQTATLDTTIVGAGMTVCEYTPTSVFTFDASLRRALSHAGTPAMDGNLFAFILRLHGRDSQ
jgi:hypothetical protein